MVIEIVTSTSNRCILWRSVYNFVPVVVVSTMVVVSSSVVDGVEVPVVALVDEAVDAGIEVSLVLAIGDCVVTIISVVCVAFVGDNVVSVVDEIVLSTGVDDVVLSVVVTSDAVVSVLGVVDGDVDPPVAD